MYQVEPVIYRREQKGEVPFVDTMDGNYLSHVLYEAGKRAGTPKMSIGVLGFKHLDDTKRCVESVLRFVGDIDYELILVDNGSQDDNETLEYYQSVPTTRKKIIQVEDPLGRDYGSVFGTRLMYEYASGDIFVFLGNDNIITENALQNMLICLESSPDIGLVTPMSSNAYMLQNPMLRYSTIEEMFAAAKEFNRSDPRKWQERMELATVATAIKREVLIQAGFYGFWTAESDLCHRIRRAGYKTVLLGDTWVCHNHDYSSKKESQGWLDDTDNSKKKMETMRGLTLNRSGGLEQFKDIMVFEHQLISLLNEPASKTPDILAVDVRAGQPLLDVKNKLREYDIFNPTAAAFSTNAKYFTMLSTITDRVFCDRIQFLQEDLEGQQFDIILLGEPVNLYPQPESLLKALLGLLKQEGQLLLKVRNSCDAYMLKRLLGDTSETGGTAGGTGPIDLQMEALKAMAAKYGATKMKMLRRVGNYDPQTVQAITNILINTKAVNNLQEAVENILTVDFLYYLKK